MSAWASFPISFLCLLVNSLLALCLEVVEADQFCPEVSLSLPESYLLKEKWKVEGLNNLPCVSSFFLRRQEGGEWQCEAGVSDAVSHN